MPHIPPTLIGIMSRDVVTVRMDDTLEQIRAVFLAKRFHHVIVVDNGRVVGVISDRDLLKNISPFIGQPLMERSQDVKTLKRRAHQIMSRAPIVAEEGMTPHDAAMLMLENRVSCLPVVDGNMRIRGIVTWRDLLRASYPVRNAA